MKSFSNTCAWCGAEYDTRNIVDGRVRGYRPLYCSRDCQYKAKKQKERERKKRIAEKEKQTAQPKPRKNHDEYKRWRIKPGPASWANCMGCPFQGWVCRSHDYPRCRWEAQYKQDCDKILALYGEDRWL